MLKVVIDSLNVFSDSPAQTPGKCLQITDGPTCIEQFVFTSNNYLLNYKGSTLDVIIDGVIVKSFSGNDYAQYQRGNTSSACENMFELLSTFTLPVIA